MSDDGAGGDATAAPPELVSGEIVIVAGSPAFAGATARVRLEDVSYADAPAQVVAEAVIRDVRHHPTAAGGDTVIPFALRPNPDAPAVVPENDYAVRVWIDRDGDGRRGPGDLDSDQSYRVLTRGFGRTVTITLGAGAGRGGRAGPGR